MIVDLLPKFEQIEVNNLKGLQPGFVVAQMPVKEGCAYIKDVNRVKYFENGHILLWYEEIWKFCFLKNSDEKNILFHRDKLHTDSCIFNLFVLNCVAGGARLCALKNIHGVFYGRFFDNMYYNRFGGLSVRHIEAGN